MNNYISVDAHWERVTMWAVGFSLLAFVGGYKLGQYEGRESVEAKIATRNAAFQSEVNASAKDHGRLPETVCATWYTNKPVHSRWDTRAVATTKVVSKAVCLFGDQIYILPEDLP